MGSHPEVDAHYRPRRIGLTAALNAAGTDLDDIKLVVNCHLHFDHCGNNPALTARPIFVQAAELAAASQENYTLPELVDATGLDYEELSGEAEILDGLVVMPTPGHTDGHQSVVVRNGDGTVVVLAGQSHDTASEYGADVMAVRAAAEGHPPPLPVPPAWVNRLRELDPRRVYFAHDHAVWTPH
jgi:N-acyl homoserine lactone hydrolase